MPNEIRQRSIVADINIYVPRIRGDEPIWARCLCPGQDTATFDFYFGIHEYEG